MPPQKKQHYVPQCILRNFTNNQNQFYLFQVLKNKIIDRMVPYKDHCYTDYLYGKDHIWENWLGDHEKEIAPIFRLILTPFFQRPTSVWQSLTGLKSVLTL